MGLIECFIEWFVFGSIASRIASSRQKEWLKECRVSDPQEGIEVFCYKGGIYDREKFVFLAMRHLQDVKYSHIKSALADAEKELERGGKNAELVAAYISAYLRVLAEKKKPLFYIDDGLD